MNGLRERRANGRSGHPRRAHTELHPSAEGEIYLVVGVDVETLTHPARSLGIIGHGKGQAKALPPGLEHRLVRDRYTVPEHVVEAISDGPALARVCIHEQDIGIELNAVRKL